MGGRAEGGPAGSLSTPRRVGRVTAVANPESWASSPVRRRIMQSNRQRDTSPEMAVRRVLHARGLRYRVDTRPMASVRRRADIVFPRQKLAVFIDGCFWHGCPVHGTRSFKTNSLFWQQKIERNLARDLDTTAQLESAGWRVLRFWEHLDPKVVANEIEAAVCRST